MLRKETLHFIKEVAENNNREWFALHKQEYEEAKADVLKLVTQIIPELARIDPLIPSDLDPQKMLA